MGLDRKAGASSCVLFLLCALSASRSVASDGDIAAAHTAELIRLHHETIALPGSMPEAQRKIESLGCEQPGDPARNDARKSPPQPAPDA